MQKLIANYFFEHNTCNIPNLGLLKTTTTSAQFHFGEKQMEAPKQTIVFETNNSDNAFVNYVAQCKNCNITEAETLIGTFVDKVKMLDSSNEIDIAFVGKFKKSKENELVFEQNIYPEPFLPNVAAEKIIHKNDAHSMVVGDVETNTAAMTEYLEPKAKSKFNKWWISAIVIAALSLILLSVYFLGGFKLGLFNNVNSINANNADSTYSIKK
jgi:hypothetical protein